jgi:hypothetical protein
MDDYESVRRFVMIEGGSRRASADLFGIDRKTDARPASSTPAG